MKSQFVLGMLVLAMAFVSVPLLNAVETTGADSEASDQIQSPTHRQVRMIKPTLNGQPARLRTMASTADGSLLVGLSPMVSAGTQSPGVVQRLDSRGEVKESWPLDVAPTALTVAPDGAIYVGGSGRVALLGQNGSVTKMIDSPHVGDIEELKEKTAKAIRASRARMSEVYTRQIDMLKERVAKIEEKPEDERSRLEEAQLRAFNSQLQSYQRLAAPADAEIPESQLNAAISRSLNVVSMAASEKDVFLCATDPESGGYSIWRMNRVLDAETSKVVMTGLRGCCGQMDIQCCKNQLVISENTRFRVGIYDRDGEPVSFFGKRDRTSRDGFGSCCNPMNSMPLDDGSILTAESSIGHIKRFDTEGNLVAYIGKATIGAGCKHCAMGYDSENDLYYMMYQDQNAVCVLANNKSTPMTVAEKQLEQRRLNFLAKAAGKWDLKETKATTASQATTIFSGGRAPSSRHPVSSLRIDHNGNAKILEGMYKAYGDTSQLELLEGESTQGTSFALAIDQVRFLEGHWKFIDDDTAQLTFSRMGAVTLHRTEAASCQGEDCKNPDCEGEECPQHQVADSSSVDLVSSDDLSNVGSVVAAGYPIDEPFDSDPFDDDDVEDSVVEEIAEVHEVESFSADPFADEDPASEEVYEAVAAEEGVDVAAVNLAEAYQNELKEYEAAMLEALEAERPVEYEFDGESFTPKLQYKLISKKKLGKNPQKTLNQLGNDGWDYCGKLGKQMMFKRYRFDPTMLPTIIDGESAMIEEIVEETAE